MTKLRRRLERVCGEAADETKTVRTRYRPHGALNSPQTSSRDWVQYENEGVRAGKNLEAGTQRRTQSQQDQMTYTQTAREWWYETMRRKAKSTDTGGQNGGRRKRALTLSSCLHAKSSSWPTGRRSNTGREMDFIDDSIISAPYCPPRNNRPSAITIASQEGEREQAETHLDDARARLALLVRAQGRAHEREVRHARQALPLVRRPVPCRHLHVRVRTRIHACVICPTASPPHPVHERRGGQGWRGCRGGRRERGGRLERWINAGSAVLP